MRAVCEACERPQPVDWSPGDLCVHCGKAARREVRCYWCAKWTPQQGKFCRKCAAAVIEPALYGPARMLKLAGVDRFTIPKQLLELDPGQVETFGALYQQQAAVVAAHVEQVRWLERFLHWRHWSQALEDELIPLLPWEDERRAPAPPRPLPDDPLKAVQEIEKASPFPVTRELALVARATLGDRKAPAAALLSAADPGLRAEAALALSHWRVLQRIDRWEDGPPRRELIRELQACEASPQVAVRLALLTGQPDVRQELGATDPDHAFMAALALGDCDRLSAALRHRDDPAMLLAAAERLARAGVHVLPPLPMPHLATLLATLNYQKRPMPELREELFDLAEADDPGRGVAEACAELIARFATVDDAARLARAGSNERDVFLPLLNSKALPPEGFAVALDIMLARGLFTHSRYGMDRASQPGCAPDDWAIRAWAGADAEAKVEIAGFIERQLEARSYAPAPALERLLAQTAFSPAPEPLREAVWNTLHRISQRREAGSASPFLFSAEAVAARFDSMEIFLARLTAFLADRDAIGAFAVKDSLVKFLRYADPSIVPPMLEHVPSAARFSERLLDTMSDEAVDRNFRLDLVYPLILMAGAPELRAPIVAGLAARRGLFEQQIDYALSRISAGE